MAGIDTTNDGATVKFGEAVTESPLLAKGAAAQELEARSSELDDAGGSGNPVVLRRFTIQLPPRTKISSAELLKHHRDRVFAFLIKDGLDPIGEPRVFFQKKGKVDIFVTASPLKGHLLHQKPQSLKQVLA